MYPRIRPIDRKKFTNHRSFEDKLKLTENTTGSSLIYLQLKHRVDWLTPLIREASGRPQAQAGGILEGLLQ